MANPTYDRRKAQGICVNCGKEPARPGRTMCEFCAETIRKKSLDRIESARQLGLCIHCKVKPSLLDSSMCSECKAKNKKRMKNRYHERKLAGQCVGCGGIPVSNALQCEQCLEDSRRKTIQSQNRSFPERIQAFERDDYICRLCGSPKRLSIHHLDGNGHGNTDVPNDDMSNLISLCSSCHAKLEHMRAYYPDKELLCKLILA